MDFIKLVREVFDYLDKEYDDVNVIMSEGYKYTLEVDNSSKYANDSVVELEIHGGYLHISDENTKFWRINNFTLLEEYLQSRGIGTSPLRMFKLFNDFGGKLYYDLEKFELRYLMAISDRDIGLTATGVTVDAKFCYTSRTDGYVEIHDKRIIRAFKRMVAQVKLREQYNSPRAGHKLKTDDDIEYQFNKAVNDKIEVLKDSNVTVLKQVEFDDKLILDKIENVDDNPTLKDALENYQKAKQTCIEVYKITQG